MDQLKLFVEQNREKVMWGLCAVLVVGAYGVGYMQAKGTYTKVAVEVSESPSISPEASSQPTPLPGEAQGPVVASSRGQYYYPLDCPGKSILNPATIITFNTINDAKAKGYTLSPRCSP